MSGSPTRYEAVTAKARAMYGKRLRRSDYTAMAAMKSVVEVVTFLRGHENWGLALESLSIADLHRDRLESLLRRHSFAHFLRLFNYVGREDRSILRYPVLAAEMEQILRFLRLASSGQTGEYVFDLPVYFKTFSRIRYDLLSSAKTYDELLGAVRNTDYHASLEKLRPPPGQFPSYLEMETQMRRSYHRSLAQSLRGRGGRTGALLREAAGLQADWENIVMIERILRYYPALLGEIFQYLMPAGTHIKPVELRMMIMLEDPDDLRDLLKTTYYGPFVAAGEDSSLERIGQACLMTFFRRYMASGAPSVFMPVAYIGLYQNELRNIIHVLESVRYGLPQEECESFLVL